MAMSLPFDHRHQIPHTGNHAHSAAASGDHTASTNTILQPLQQPSVTDSSD